MSRDRNIKLILNGYLHFPTNTHIIIYIFVAVITNLSAIAHAGLHDAHDNNLVSIHSLVNLMTLYCEFNRCDLQYILRIRGNECGDK